MILLASGRCDIPAFYSEWFFQRMVDGFIDVRNPYHEHQISRIFLNDKNIDGIAFCTKNPIPMLNRLDEIPFPYVFHITITPYMNEIEPQVIDKRKIIQAVIQLSKKLGKEKVIVRYDPIFINEKYTVAYHALAFERLCEQLQDYVSAIVISFIDDYKNVRKHKDELNMIPIDNAMMIEIAKYLGPIGKKYHMKIQTCAEKIDLKEYGILSTPCFEKEHISKIFQRNIEGYDKPSVRKNCDCLPTVDIGDYNCCDHHCKYCYANYDEQQIAQRMQLHDPLSTVLIGHIGVKDKITVREEKAVKQVSLF